MKMPNAEYQMLNEMPSRIESLNRRSRRKEALTSKSATGGPRPEIIQSLLTSTPTRFMTRASGRPFVVFLVAAMVGLVAIGSALAQTFAVDWFRIASGGGTCTGGQYSATGTLGQPEAGMLHGGAYGLVGGFWGVIQTAGAPWLSVTHSNNTVVVYWPLPATGFVLEQTMALSSPSGNISWNQVAFPYQTNATHIFITIPPSTAHKFFRLRKP